MTVLQNLATSVGGSEETDVVKARALAVTRGSGVVGAAFLAATNFTWLGDDLTKDQRFTMTVVVGLAWVFLAAVDIAARSYVTAHAGPATSGGATGSTDSAATASQPKPAPAGPTQQVVLLDGLDSRNGLDSRKGDSLGGERGLYLAEIVGVVSSENATSGKAG